MKLELGCGAKPTDGYVHHDQWQHDDYVDVVHNLDLLPWPWADESAEEILAIDVMEHLRLEVHEWMAECWRILRPGGKLTVRLPAWNHPQGYSFRDPTHRRVFHLQSLWYFCPNAPGTLWQNFGRYMFGADYRAWWQYVSSEIESGDIKTILTKEPRLAA